MITRHIRETYPAITKPELDSLPNESLNKLVIKFNEDMVRNCKEMLTGLFKDKETEYPDWYKDLLREMKTHHERALKTVVFEQKYLRDGLNPPFCYPKSDDNPYGFINKNYEQSTAYSQRF